MEKIAATGIWKVQIHEPSLTSTDANQLMKYLPLVYGTKAKKESAFFKNIPLQINLVCHYGIINEWKCFSMDFKRIKNSTTIFGFHY